MATHRRARRGNSAAYFALALPVIGGFAALAIEYAYVEHVQIQLDGVADAAAHAAIVEITAPDATTASARQIAIDVTDGLLVEDAPFQLLPEDIQFGHLDDATGVFTVTETKGQINAVRVPLVLEDVGLGFGHAFFGRGMTVSACSAARYGNGNASTGTVGGPGLANGHFDYDTTNALVECPGPGPCTRTSKHTHEFDDRHDVTSTDQFSWTGGHMAVDGCNPGDPPSACGSGDTWMIPADLGFRITVVNADLSPGAWLTINGVDHDVTDYDDIPVSALPVYSLSGAGGTIPLTELKVNFDIDTIANCQLHPTNTKEVKKNRRGVYGEWRSGALTVQLVRTDAVFSPGQSNGGHDVVENHPDGLLYEAIHFWHWEGPSYVPSRAEAWQAQYDLMDCPSPEFIDEVAGVGACP